MDVWEVSFVCVHVSVHGSDISVTTGVSVCLSVQMLGLSLCGVGGG